ALPSDTVETCNIPWEVCTPLERLTKVELYRNGSGTDIKVTAHGHSSAIVDGSYPVFDVAFTIHTDSEETDYENRYEEIHDYNRKTVLFSDSLGSFQVPLIIIPYHNHGYKFNDIAITKTASANGIPDGHPGNWTDYVNCSTVLPDPVPHQYPGEHKCNCRVVRYWVDIKGQVIDVSYSSPFPDSQFDGYYSQQIDFHPNTYPALWGAYTKTDDGHSYKSFYMLSAMDPKFSPPNGELLTWMQEFKWNDRSDTYFVNPGDFPEMSITFVPAEDGAAYDGYTPYAYRPQPIGKPITHFQVSVNFAGGIYHMKKDGGYGREDVTIRIAYRKIGDEEWTADSHDVWGNSTDEKGYTYEYDVPEGEYEVKVGLQGSEDSQANNQGSWENLAGIIGEKQVYEGMTTVFCCLQSSNIFSGTNYNQISSFFTRQRNNSGTRVEMSTIEDAAIYLVQSSKYFSMPARLDYAAFKDAQAK
ncbi:TipJ family phage tail tip protein, partial [Enterococcus innesii]|uniref:TipJ family phage tail tip protein n=1 Tax=Enterococcus innesii TaxID=2839759 RepID=UPI003DA4D3C9